MIFMGMLQNAFFQHFIAGCNWLYGGCSVPVISELFVKFHYLNATSENTLFIIVKNEQLNGKYGEFLIW